MLPPARSVLTELIEDYGGTSVQSEPRFTGSSFPPSEMQILSRLSSHAASLFSLALCCAFPSASPLSRLDTSLRYFQNRSHPSAAKTFLEPRGRHEEHCHCRRIIRRTNGESGDHQAVAARLRPPSRRGREELAFLAPVGLNLACPSLTPALTTRCRGYSFAYPRFAIVPNHEPKAFLPFATMLPSPHKILPATKVLAVSPERRAVRVLDSSTGVESELDYEVLILATGTRLSPPGTIPGDGTKRQGVEYLRSLQARLAGSKRIVILGGGAIGCREFPLCARV